MTSSRFRAIISLLLMGILLAFTVNAVGDVDGEGFVVEQVYHEPVHPEPEGALTMVLEFEDISNISSVEIFMCSMEPLFCFYADYMDYVGNNTFESQVDYQGHGFKKGSVLGYNFEITYNEGTTEKFPNGSTFKDHENILEVDEGIYYLTVTIGENEPLDDNGEDTGFISIYIMILMLTMGFVSGVAAIYIRRIKGKKQSE